ncbi:hypothetical protein J5N97_000295 [Dioscorea zingiberensis]|uniref:Uncharacterized protein n=1 Tax=Dioscorea zingiberensis TaxID=325984 RepID=A0A9D5BSG4_9LILI|nr:hypothetical protein J5N97_000295 [Dioscorea zingiberensis]
MYLDEERDHYNSPWSSEQLHRAREMREWLFKLLVGKPGSERPNLEGACLALNVGKWSEILAEICAFHKLPSPTDDERLPVGTGSNPVYLMSNCVIKIFVEEGLETPLYGLGAESSLDLIANCNFIREKVKGDVSPFGVWRKKQFEYRKAGVSTNESVSLAEYTRIWPYLITKRCKGKIYAELRDTVSREDELNLASFLGEQLRNLHLLPHPPLNISTFSDIEQGIRSSLHQLGSMDAVPNKSNIPAEWDIFIRTLSKKKKDVSSRLIKWEINS